MSDRRKQAVILAIAVLLLATVARASGGPIINVYVTTATSAQGFVDNDSRQRSDSVRDLKRGLTGKKTHVVETSEQADVIVTVTQRYTTPNLTSVLYVDLRAGDYKTTFMCATPAGTFGPWTQDASQISQQIEAWIKMNHDRVIAQRTNGEGEQRAAEETDSAPAQPVKGTVNASSNPSGADILVDGEFVGNSPAALKLSPGKHTVTVKMSGYTDRSREITVESGSEAGLAATLQK